MNFGYRRARNTAGVLAAGIAAVFTFEIIDLSIQVQQYYSGWFMIFLMAILVVFYVKKRLIVVGMGSGGNWAQWHYYIGLFLFIIYLKHVEFSFPDGLVESTITVFYLIVMISGVCGVFINRVFARRLSYLEEDIIYERIPVHLKKLRHDVEGLIIDSVENSGSTTLSDYYLQHLAGYFEKPQFFFTHLLGSNYGFLRVKDGLDRQMRYLNKKEAEYALNLNNMLQKKNLLDTHLALQRVLKYWGTLHFPMALILVLVTFVHVVLVYAFRGAA
ncbi:hypothetical protein A9Q99_17505 [Gammaproteobacteria bacterium 45_16_T64]|nr:hypothetical protein A9Q99_17505 [Gammaproteobacteria bacterium 45_16_T64]